MAVQVCRMVAQLSVHPVLLLGGAFLGIAHCCSAQLLSARTACLQKGTFGDLSIPGIGLYACRRLIHHPPSSV